MGVEVPFRTPTSVLFFIITILAAYYAKQPDTVAVDALRTTDTLRSR